MKSNISLTIFLSPFSLPEFYLSSPTNLESLSLLQASRTEVFVFFMSPIISCVCSFHLKFLWTPSANLSDRRVASLLFPVIVFLFLPFLLHSFFTPFQYRLYVHLSYTHSPFPSKSPSHTGISFNKLDVCTSIIFSCLALYISCLHHIIDHRAFNLTGSTLGL